MIFHNRKHAGMMLAKAVLNYRDENPLVLALPRGGVPIASEIADALNAPLDVLIVRKIGSPFQSELAVGALCEDAEPLWSDHILARLGLEPDDLRDTVEIESEKIKSQTIRFREGRQLPSINTKTAIIVDDGLATGATVSAAVDYLRGKGAAKIVVAVPVGASSTARKLRKKVDDLIVLEEREDLNSVGEWYEDFSQVSDEEVVSILNAARSEETSQSVQIDVDHGVLEGDLTTRPSMKALIVFAHGSGSSRRSPRNQQVARYLNRQGFGTLLFDLLTDEESLNRENVFNIEFLSQRLVSVTKWLRQHFEEVPLGYFGASTGAGAALRAATKLSSNEGVYAIVSRGGRPDLAGQALASVKAPTLLIVGGRDFEVIELNRRAQYALSDSKLVIIPGATHLFEESGALEEVAREAAEWFKDYLPNQKLKSRLKLWRSRDNSSHSENPHS